MLCIFFLNPEIKYQNTKKYLRRDRSGKRERERFSGERKRAPARSVERESFRSDPARETVFSTRSGRDFMAEGIPERERERERNFPTRSGRESVKRRTAGRREREIWRRDPAEIPSRERLSGEKKREKGRFFCPYKDPNTIQRRGGRTAGRRRERRVGRENATLGGRGSAGERERVRVNFERERVRWRRTADRWRRNPVKEGRPAGKRECRRERESKFWERGRVRVNLERERESEERSKFWILFSFSSVCPPIWVFLLFWFVFYLNNKISSKRLST
jgi:hypothetical protein